MKKSSWFIEFGTGFFKPQFQQNVFRCKIVRMVSGKKSPGAHCFAVFYECTSCFGCVAFAPEKLSNMHAKLKDVFTIRTQTCASNMKVSR